MPDAELTSALHRSLRQLQRTPCLSLASPPSVPRRASVAVVIRVEPDPAHRPVAADEPAAISIDEFFARPWVRHGEPEMLFIKRAARAGDRWTSHVAYPGGKRDADDADDLAAAVRETMEEVGVDITRGLACGKLPDRLVTTQWGTVPLMVLCPFVFLLTAPTAPAFNLQPAEVASAHWVPLRILLAPAFRTTFACDVSDRLARQGGAAVRWGLRASLGQMCFAAVRLWPSHSVFSVSRDFFAPAESRVWDSSLRLWGLTLGVVQDLLETLPPAGTALAMWDLPTFTAWDARLVVWLVSHRLTERNRAAAAQNSLALMLQAEAGVGVEAETKAEAEVGQVKPRPREVECRVDLPVPTCSVDHMLHGYYPAVRTAVWITLCGRATLTLGTIAFYVWRRRALQ